MMFRPALLGLMTMLAAVAVVRAEPTLGLSVYATAGDVLHYLARPEDRERVLPLL